MIFTISRRKARSSNHACMDGRREKIITYGLNVPKSKTTSLSVFERDDDEEEVVKVEKRVKIEIPQEIQVYEEEESLEPSNSPPTPSSNSPSKPSSNSPHNSHPTTLERPKPKYMESLLARATERKARNERAKVRMMQREAHDGAPITSTETDESAGVFVTSSYLAKLEAMRADMDKDRQEEAEGDPEKSVKGRSMAKFHANLMTRNVAFGSGKARIFSRGQASNDFDSGPKRKI